MAKEKYVVDGIKGKHCRERIENTISSLEGVDEVDVNLNTKQVTVQYDSAVISGEYIQETLQTLGYTIQG